MALVTDTDSVELEFGEFEVLLVSVVCGDPATSLAPLGSRAGRLDEDDGACRREEEEARAAASALCCWRAADAMSRSRGCWCLEDVKTRPVLMGRGRS